MNNQNGIRPMVRRFLTSFLKTNLSFDIETRLRMRTLDSICEYIEKNIVDVIMYNCPEKLMETMLKEVIFDGFYSECRVSKGWFSDTLPDFVKYNNEKIAFIHIDYDLYSSTKTEYNFLKDRFVEGGIIFFDEYFAYPFWQNFDYKVFNGFVAQNNLDYEYLSYSTNSFGTKVGMKIL
ncbi:MAG: TylF/MycF/NovP-related O-methyltransferase [Bacteroidales bacterium]